MTLESLGGLGTNTSACNTQPSHYKMSSFLTSNACVSVTVLDVNDHRPVFSDTMYELNVAEDTSVNSRFRVVSATDSDSNTNAQITYSADITSE